MDAFISFRNDLFTPFYLLNDLYHSSYSLLIVFVLFNVTSISLLQKSRRQPSSLYIPATAIFFTEVAKVILSISFETVLNQQGSLQETMAILWREFVLHYDTILRQIFPPAFIYSIQYFLTYFALDNLQAVPYRVTYQSRIFLVAIMHGSVTLVQFVSMCTLFVGTLLVQFTSLNSNKQKCLPSDSDASLTNPQVCRVRKLLDFDSCLVEDNFDLALRDIKRGKSNESANADGKSPFLGMLATITMAFCSSKSGVLFEEIVKKEPSIWISDIKLSSFSALCIFVMAFLGNGKVIMEHGFTAGYTWETWLVILLQASFGLVATVVVKAQNCLIKVYASSISLVVHSLLSTLYIGDLAPSSNLYLGVFLVVSASLIFANRNKIEANIYLDQLSNKGFRRPFVDSALELLCLSLGQYLPEDWLEKIRQSK